MKVTPCLTLFSEHWGDQPPTCKHSYQAVWSHVVALCHIPNSTWIPKVLLSHSWVISVWSPSYPQVLPSTLKYSRVSRVKPEPVHLPPYTRIICISPSLALSLLRDFGIPALYYSLYTLYTRNWHTSEFLSFRVHIPFRPLYILVPLLTPFGPLDLRALRGSVPATRHSHSSGTLLLRFFSFFTIYFF